MGDSSNPAHRRRLQIRAAVTIKRMIDLALGSALLVVASPLLAAAALAVWIDDGRPMFFTQDRVGRRGRRIRLHKFRSMRLHDAPVEEVGQVSSDHELVTRSGRWLRRLKIDELPQLLGVVKGDLSLVGPRPTIPEQVSQYTPFELRRLEVRPGLTGWAQVNGNTTIPWNERIALDVWYIDNWSLSRDMQILARTVSVIVQGEQPNPRAIEEAMRHADRLGRSG